MEGIFSFLTNVGKNLKIVKPPLICLQNFLAFLTIHLIFLPKVTTNCYKSELQSLGINLDTCK